MVNNRRKILICLIFLSIIAFGEAKTGNSIIGNNITNVQNISAEAGIFDSLYISGIKWVDKNIYGNDGIYVDQTDPNNINIGHEPIIYLKDNGSYNYIFANNSYLIMGATGRQNNLYLSNDIGGMGFTGTYYLENSYRADLGAAYNRIYTADHSIVLSSFEFDPINFQLRSNQKNFLYYDGDNISVNNNNIQDLSYPLNNNDAANKIYVDDVISSQNTILSDLQNNDTYHDANISQLKVNDTYHDANISQLKVNDTYHDANISQLKVNDTYHDANISQLKVNDTNASQHINNISNPHSTTLEQVRSKNNTLLGELNLNNNLIDGIKILYSVFTTYHNSIDFQNDKIISIINDGSDRNKMTQQWNSTTFFIGGFNVFNITSGGITLLAGIFNANNNKIINLGNATSNYDAANKIYVDEKFNSSSTPSTTATGLTFTGFDHVVDNISNSNTVTYVDFLNLTLSANNHSNIDCFIVYNTSVPTVGIYAWVNYTNTVSQYAFVQTYNNTNAWMFNYSTIKNTSIFGVSSASLSPLPITIQAHSVQTQKGYFNISFKPETTGTAQIKNGSYCRMTETPGKRYN